MTDIKGIIGAGENCQFTKLKLSPPKSNQIQIKIAYAGVNRADVEQSLGLYPPPSGASEVLGLECSGVVEKVGDSVRSFKVGDQVMALLTGGGFATHVNSDAETVLPVPEHLTLAEAAVIPESLFTFWANAVMDGGLAAGKSFLVHGGASGLGSFSIQMAKVMGCSCYSTGKGAERVSFIQGLGVDKVIDTDNIEETELNEKMLSIFGENSVDVIMDHLGAQFLDAHLNILKKQGRIVFINAVSGERGPLDYDLLIGKRIQLIGSILRGRSLQEKDSIRLSIEKGALPILKDQLLRPKVDSEIPIEDFERAFQRLTDRKNQGKIVLKVTDR